MSEIMFVARKNGKTREFIAQYFKRLQLFELAKRRRRRKFKRGV